MEAVSDKKKKLNKVKISSNKWLVEFQYTLPNLLIVCLMVAYIYCAITTLGGNYPIFPPNYFTISWILALFFPVFAIAYIGTGIRIRVNEIMEVFRQEQLWCVYYPEDGDRAEVKFLRFLWTRHDEYYNPVAFGLFSILAGSFVFIICSIIMAHLGVPLRGLVAVPVKNIIEMQPDPKYFSVLRTLRFGTEPWVIPVGSGFLGSVSGALVFLLRRFQTFDLRPMAFLQISVALVAGTFCGAFITLISPRPELGVIAFIVGFLSAINVDFLSRLMRKQFARLTGISLQKDIPTDLAAIVKNNEAIDSLNAISIYSIRELANADPVRLYMVLPQQIKIVNVMIDQALLCFYFHSLIKELEAVHIQLFTQLVLALNTGFSRNSITWTNEPSILDDGGPKDINLLKRTKEIIEGKLDHRILGLLLQEYRDGLLINNHEEECSFL